MRPSLTPLLRDSHPPRFGGGLAWFAAGVLAVAAGLAFAQPPARRPTSVSGPGVPEPASPTPPAAQADAGYKLQPGPYAAGFKRLTLRDEARAKELGVLVRFPQPKRSAHGAPADKVHAGAIAPEQTFPLVVFSHGMGGSSDAFPDLTQHWATHGYIVVLPTHDDSIRLRREKGEDVKVSEALSREGTRQVDVKGRVDDVKFLLDALATIEQRVPELARPGQETGRIDRDKLMVAGHSAGAMTAQICVGAKVRGPQFQGGLVPRSYADARLKGAVLISPQGTTTRLFTKDSWKQIDRPFLVVTGSQDTSPVTNETPQSRKEPFELAAPGEKYLLWIEGATHSSYAGKQAAGFLREKPETDVRTIQDAVASCTLALLDQVLRDEASAREYLAGDRVSTLTGSKGTLTRR